MQTQTTKEAAAGGGRGRGGGEIIWPPIYPEEDYSFENRNQWETHALRRCS